MILDQELAWLAAEGSEAERQAMTRYGIPNDTAFGVPMGRLLARARRRPKDPALATALWATGRYEARVLAVLLDDPAALPRARMDAMVAGFDSWAICDTACFHLLDRSPHAWAATHDYAANDALYVRRTAFALLWSLSVHDKTADDAGFRAGLGLAGQYLGDDRPHVSKAVSMAVRAIGKRNYALRTAVLDFVDRIEADGSAGKRLARNIRRDLAKGAKT